MDTFADIQELGHEQLAHRRGDRLEDDRKATSILKRDRLLGDLRRLIGRPARLASLKRFIEYAKSHEQVWFSRRVDIARHWHETHPYQGAAK